MKPLLQMNLTNQLTLTPQLQQAIRLLQLSTIDLRYEIQHTLESNPLLDTNNDEPYEESSTDYAIESEDEFSDFQWSTLYQSNSKTVQFNENSYIFENLHCTKDTLRDHLLWQVNLSVMNDIDRVIAITIIDAIDDNGYLTVSVADIFKSLNSDDYPLEEEEIKTVLHRIQRLDPVGCGAENLADALLIQLEQYANSIPYLAITQAIITNHINLLGQHNYQKIKKIYHIDNVVLQQILTTISHMHPQPGRLIPQSQPEYVIPDLIVKKKDNRWRVALNPDTLPKLSINTQYASLIKRANNSADNQFLKNNLNQARWFLKSIQSRQDTLWNVTDFIVNFQQDFFEYGEQAMKPLILSDVAEALGMHESTISRITTQKYIYTPRGLFELKYFFSSHVSTSEGDTCSSTVIRALIKKSIATENRQKPLSDAKLALLLLTEKGIKIARRTITKYREAMNIPPSFERKHI